MSDRPAASALGALHICMRPPMVPPPEPPRQKLADRCFALETADTELFDTVCRILGADPHNCLADNFVWPVEDTWWDSYDSSVEVVRPATATWMTSEQVAAILELGFDRVYESRGGEGRLHVTGGWSPCDPQEAEEVRRLRATVAALRKGQS
jgi:hypothetical protein